MNRREAGEERGLDRWRQGLMELLGRYKYALLVAAVGAALMLLPGLGGTEEEPAAQAQVQAADFGTRELEERLEEALSRIDGVGQARVVLTLRSGPTQVLAQDTRQSAGESGSDAERTTVVLNRGSGNQETVVVRQLSPQYQGALVVCSGGEDPAVRLRVVEAVAAVTGLGSDRISVSKGK